MLNNVHVNNLIGLCDMEKVGTLGKEKILASLHPHPLAFAGQALLWIYVLVVSVTIYFVGNQVNALFKNIPVIGGLIGAYGEYVVYALVIIIPTLIYAAVKIVWRYFLITLLITVGVPLVLAFAVKLPLRYTFIIGAVVGILGVLAVEIHRRAHKYIITDRRIIFEYKGLFKKIRRDLVYSRVSDIILEKGALGKLFNFGNLIPVSQPGLGLGSDMSFVTLGGSVGKDVRAGFAVTGGRSVKVPRSRSFYMLYGVPRPERVYDMIVEAIKASEEAPYLKKILDKMDQGSSLNIK